MEPRSAAPAITSESWRPLQPSGKPQTSAPSPASHAQPVDKPSSGIDAPAGGGAGSDAFTILRIKRKRHEEPLDTLVVQEQLEKLDGKRQRRFQDKAQQENRDTLAGDVASPKLPPAVFRLATTVNTDSFKDPTQSIQLREKIARFTESPRPRSRVFDRHMPEFDERISERREVLAQEKLEQARSARYRVVHQNRTGLASSDQRPPEVKSSVQARAEAALEMFKMYDAVKEDEPRQKRQLARDEEESDIMCNFLPMVREYLTISDKTSDPKIVADLPDGSSVFPVPTFSGGDEQDSEDEYVYDIYYRDLHAVNEQDPGLRNIGSLLWFSDDENNFMNEDDSSEDDYEDSDSNAEDYYQNDYPEDEVSDEEYAYELSDSDDDGNGY